MYILRPYCVVVPFWIFVDTTHFDLSVLWLIHDYRVIYCVIKSKCSKETHPAGSKIGEVIERNCVVRLDLVVVALVGEGKGQHALLLQVRFMNSSK